MTMRCLEHLELCPYCNSVALKVCEYSEPYPRVEAECQCCGYRAYDTPMSVDKKTLYQILDKLSRKEVGAVCLDDKCGSTDIIKLIQEGRYTEYRCLECGAEWNSYDMIEAIRKVKKIGEYIKNGELTADKLRASEGECPLCGWDIGHLHEGYMVEIICPVCGYHNNFKEEFPEYEPPEYECSKYEKAEETG